jgi:NAD(P) transhydrogenase
MAFNGSISYFIDTVFNYPTLAEAYKIAALNGLKRLGAQGQNDRKSPPKKPAADSDLKIVTEGGAGSA